MSSIVLLVPCRDQVLDRRTSRQQRAPSRTWIAIPSSQFGRPSLQSSSGAHSARPRAGRHHRQASRPDLRHSSSTASATHSGTSTLNLSRRTSRLRRSNAPIKAMHHPRSSTILAFLCLLITAAVGAAEKPNILFIAIDDQNDWIGYLGGHPQAQDPATSTASRRAARPSPTPTASRRCATPHAPA